MTTMTILPRVPITDAARAAIATCHERAFAADLLFLEAWEHSPDPGMGSALRARQIRRANPDLAAKIREQIKILARQRA